MSFAENAVTHAQRHAMSAGTQALRAGPAEVISVQIMSTSHESPIRAHRDMHYNSQFSNINPRDL
jgi:sortase (surface protein transpeptidase)